MAMTIGPAVRGTPTERIASGSLFGIGVFSGVVTIYALAHGLMTEHVRISNDSALVLVGIVATWAALRDVTPRVPVPYLNRQVPEWFRSLLPAWITAGSFGYLLGLGFVTKFTFGVHMTAVAALVFFVEPAEALVAIAVYAGVRTLTASVGSTVTSEGALARSLQTLGRRRWVLRPVSVLLTATLLVFVFNAVRVTNA